MSLATSKKDFEPERIKLLPTRNVAKFMEKTAKNIRQDFFGAAAFFAVVVSGIGFLFGRQLNFYWCVLTLALVAAAFYEKFFSPITVIGMAEEKIAHVNLPDNKHKN